MLSGRPAYHLAVLFGHLLSGRPAYQATISCIAFSPLRHYLTLQSPCPCRRPAYLPPCYPAGYCLLSRPTAAALPSSAAASLHISHSCWFIFLALLSTWPSLPPGHHPLRSFRSHSRQGCPGNPESTPS